MAKSGFRVAGARRHPAEVYPTYFISCYSRAADGASEKSGIRHSSGRVAGLRPPPRPPSREANRSLDLGSRIHAHGTVWPRRGAAGKSIGPLPGARTFRRFRAWKLTWSAKLPGCSPGVSAIVDSQPARGGNAGGKVAVPGGRAGNRTSCSGNAKSPCFYAAPIERAPATRSTRGNRRFL